MKCRKCGDTAALELRRHNAAFCSPHFIEFFQKQVQEAIRHYRMLDPAEPVLVAVSGGKASHLPLDSTEYSKIPRSR